MESYKYIEKNYTMNIGIGILRMFLCFLVITFHFAGKKNHKKYKILNSSFHVPTFMLISFYFSYKTLISNDAIKYKKRFQRLLIPYIIWPIIFLLISDFRFSLNSIKIKKLLIDLSLQYITGYKTMVCLWFIQILIFFELIFQIIFSFFKQTSFLIFQMLFIISYFLQYSEINYRIFLKYSSHLRSLSHIVEMIPIAITGLTLRKIDILEKLSINKIKSIVTSMITFFFIYNYNIFGQFRYYYYSGLKQNVTGICLFISFSLIPFNKIQNKGIKDFLKLIIRYTGGIYYLQTIIFYILSKFKYLKQRPLFICILIYILGYLICAVFTILLRNNIFKYLFN